MAIVYVCTGQSASPAPRKPVELWDFQIEKERAENIVSYNRYVCQKCCMHISCVYKYIIIGYRVLLHNV